jgi:hypothetical protein
MPFVATFISNKQKCLIFSFFFYKIGEQEGGTDPAQGVREGFATSEGGVAGKEGRSVIMIQKCVQMYPNAKMIPLETIPDIRGRWDKGEW